LCNIEEETKKVGIYSSKLNDTNVEYDCWVIFLVDCVIRRNQDRDIQSVCLSFIPQFETLLHDTYFSLTILLSKLC